MLRNLMLGMSVLGLALSAVAAEAARVTPMAVDLAPTGSQSASRIEVTNNEDRQLPLEVRMYRGAISETGELDLQPADDRFMVFPPQTVIEPRSQQVFRVQYIPDAMPATSEIYYAAVSQVPVPLDPSESRIQVVMRFNVLVNVVPSGTTPDPVVSNVAVVDRDIELPADEKQPAEKQVKRTEKQRGIEVRIENKGTRYFAAGRTGWTIAGADEAGAPVSVNYTDAQMSDLIGMGIVAPGKARKFFVPTEKLLKTGSVTVTLKR
ncbi:molecular chaperone [Sphingomonas cavernae]|uniref:Molecular chaperone n=1 Tax=Sphingomonas cavernae TaxID=2320861 RepID=A0A418WQ53_9SPHN|nr:fimbria/pilus periplasmic chaperone [Sphingomonas cavernae]RJF93374.1 molecular chaperone [Sphingomonas cavernae]